MADPITAAGTSANAAGTGGSTLAVTTTAVGNLLVLGTDVASSTVHFASISGGGVTTWTHLLGPSVLSGVAQSCDLWMGVVTTAGSATITGTGSASVSSLGTTFISQEFACGGVGTTWAVDGTQSSVLTNGTATTTITFPTLTPGGANRLYIGFSQTAAQGPVTAGYVLDSATSALPLIYNVSVSTVQIPTTATFLGSANKSLTQGVLLVATAPPGNNNRVRQTPLVPRLRSINY